MNIYIDEPTERKLWGYIKAVKTEIGGFGYAKLDGDTLTWNDVFLVPQTVTGSEVDFDGSGITAAVERAAQDGVLGCEDFVWVSWHSHHTMKAFWSGTDEKCIKTYGAAGITTLLSFVGCHDHDHKVRLDLFGVEHAGISVPQVTMDDLKLRTDRDDELEAIIKQDIAQFVRKPTPKPKMTKVAGNLAAAVHDHKKKQQPKPWSFAEQTQLTNEERNEFLAAGISLDDAFEIKELIEVGVPAHEAYQMVCEGAEYNYVVGPAGLVHQGYDSMAWGD